MTTFLIIELLYSFFPVVEAISNESGTEILAKVEKLM